MRFTYKFLAAVMSENVPTFVQDAIASSPPNNNKPDMPGALQYLRDYPLAKISQVARKYHVHRRTLTNHWQGRHKRVGRKGNGGQNKIMKPGYVEAVFLYIENQAHAGFSASREMIQGAIGYMLAQEDPPRRMPTSQWTYQFLRDLPIVHKAKTRPLEMERALAQQPKDVEQWFVNYVQALEYYDVYWIHIWNFDEGGFRVGCIKEGEVWVPAYMEAVVSSPLIYFIYRLIRLDIPTFP